MTVITSMRRRPPQLLLTALLFVSVSPVTCDLSPTEEVFLSVPNADSARDNLRFFTSLPHVAGTEGDHILAAYVSQQFEDAGIPDVSTFDLDVLLNYPESPPQVSVVSTTNHTDTIFQASLSEEILDFDDTSDTFWRNHTFHGYSPSGTVVAPLIYANYGRPSDFHALEHAGIDIQGTVVLIRYGMCFRGLKVMNAQKRGALAVIIYSDPKDDGYVVGPTYPEGPWRPSFGIQRGSVQFNSKCGGDPMRADARYHNRNDSTATTTTPVQELCGVNEYTDLIPSIPSVPMSYGDAKSLLLQLGGRSAKDVGGDDFCGGLDIEYRVGPSTNTAVRVSVQNREEIRSIPNVVGYIPGTLPPEQDMPVLLGNHRDAWVYGAADPNSGTASLVEVASGLGALLQTGWTPRNSIYLLSWSGEEYGLLGSTGWAELNAEKIQRAVAYLNVDTVVSGDVLSVATTPSLATAWEQVLLDLHASKEHSWSFDNGPLGDIRDGNTNWIINHPKEKILGSGSDFTAFLDHFGVSSLDFSFGKKEATYGQYHSIYDSFAWIEAYGGTVGQKGSAFSLMAFASKIWGLLALRLADSIILPLDHVVQGEALSHYVNAIEEQESECELDLRALKHAVHQYQEAAVALTTKCQPTNTTLDTRTCNEKLGLAERQFLTEDGLPERPWFKHILQAPGLYLGYAAKAFPGIQQALDDLDLDLAKEQVAIGAKRVQAAATFLSSEDATLQPAYIES